MISRVLIDTTSTARATITDLEGDPIDPDGAVLVTVYDGAGDEYIAESAASQVLDEGSPVVGAFATTLLLDKLDDYRLHWTATIAGSPAAFDTYLQAVGGFHFSIAALRNSDPAFTGDEAAKYTGDAMLEARTSVEDKMEGKTACNVALVPRGRRHTTGGDGTNLLILPDVAVRDIYSLSVDGELLTQDELDELDVEEWGGIYRPSGQTWPRGLRNISVHYTHGLDHPPPAIRTASLIAAQEELLPSGVPHRATLQTTDVGTFRLAVAGKDGPFGIPEVDAAIEGFNRRRPAVG